MRDFYDIRADWKLWSLAERIGASVLLALTTIAIGTLFYLQS
jgi:hypothetical protein